MRFFINLNDTNILAIKLNNSESEILIKYQNRKKKLNQDLEFESILYVPEEAWNLKHKDDLNEYEYIPKYNYESRSNIDLW